MTDVQCPKSLNEPIVPREACKYRSETTQRANSLSLVVKIQQLDKPAMESI